MRGSWLAGPLTNTERSLDPRWDRSRALRGRGTDARPLCSTAQSRHSPAATQARCRCSAGPRQNPLCGIAAAPRHRPSCFRRRNTESPDEMCFHPCRTMFLSRGTLTLERRRETPNCPFPSAGIRPFPAAKCASPRERDGKRAFASGTGADNDHVKMIFLRHLCRPIPHHDFPHCRFFRRHLGNPGKPSALTVRPQPRSRGLPRNGLLARRK